MRISQAIRDFESGKLPYREFVRLFQELIDSGWRPMPEGRYGKIAKRLIDECEIEVADD